MKKILFLAPFPPPITGQAIANKTIIDNLSDQYHFDIIDYSKKNLKQGVSSLLRISQVLNVLSLVRKKRSRNEILYMNISQSYSGNLKDLLTILLCRKMKIIVHLHGGGIKDTVFRNPLFRLLNRITYKYIDKVIVLGESLTSIFDNICSSEKIRIVPNFVDELFFLREHQSKKSKGFNILYLSNLLPGKGYVELQDAAIRICNERKDVRFKFVGAFEDESDRVKFLNKINDIDNISYEGVIYGGEKVDLFFDADIFCLPSYYRFFEGQPISILEAYASHCAVISTYHGGIVDIFKDSKNGYRVENASSDSIYKALIKLFSNPQDIESFSKANFEYANENFTQSKYLDNFMEIFDSV